jgi:hypothetical protein
MAEIFIPIIGAIIAFLLVLGFLYFYSKLSRKKHWSDGYMTLYTGKKGMSRQQDIQVQPELPEQQEPQSQEENNSIFPPGW